MLRPLTCLFLSSSLSPPDVFSDFWFSFSYSCLQGLLPSAEEKQGCPGEVGRLFVFAVMWSLGALLELEDRAKMEAFLKVCFSLGAR